MVVYQIYPRSFQDSNGDGIGDLRGIEQRLDYLRWLGVDGIWLSPIYPSPLADFGYDVSGYEDVDPVYGALDEFDLLVSEAHVRGIKVLMDLVPCHTSIEHPWFREHPGWYVWSEQDGPANNWLAVFGGRAWSPDPYARGRGWYLHSFFPEQPDLNWRNPAVVAAMQDVIRFWIDRGVDGFRLDAIHMLMKDPQLRDDPPANEPFGLPLREPFNTLAHTHSMNWDDVDRALAPMREAAGDALLVGEAYLPSAKLGPYLEFVDMAFAFELLHSQPDAESLRAAVDKGRGAGAWVLSNHDFPRLATRFGRDRLRAAALLLLTLPGTAFVYQGEEIGLADGPGHNPPYDRAGRDGARHPMQWNAAPDGGFTDGEPWLPAVDAEERNVRGQIDDPGSLLTLYRKLIALRRNLPDAFEWLDAEPGVLAYARGAHVIAINFAAEPRPAPAHGEPLLVTEPLAPDGSLPPRAGIFA